MNDEDEAGQGVAYWSIQVEKDLCAKLGKPWTPSGISIGSLIDELAARAKPVVPDGLVSANRTWDRLILSFKSSDQLNDFYYACKAMLAAAPRGDV